MLTAALLWVPALGLILLQRWPTPPHRLELMLHFYPQGVLFWTLVAGVLGVFRLWQKMSGGPSFEPMAVIHWRTLLPTLLLGGFLLWPLAPYFQRPSMPVGPVSAPELRLVLANVLFTNPDPSVFGRWLAEQAADVVVIEELNRPFQAMLDQHPDYPYRHAVYTGDAFGIGVWSRQPIKVQTLSLGDAGLPSLVIQWGVETPVSLLATHPLPPIEARYFAARNQQYEALTAFLQAQPGPKLLVGDLNITPWSGYYRGLEGATGLRNSRHGQGLLPSWPSHWPALMRIPIDHVLWQGAWTSVHTEVGPDIGSDHLPVRVHFRP